MNQPTYNRLTCEHGVPEDRVRWMPNFVDLNRFKPRGPLPPRPIRALVFSNYATEMGFLRIIRAACALAELPLDVIGSGVGNPSSRPWEALGNYDLIFASGRSALESMAVGAAVIVCSHFGLGPMVTTAEFDNLRRSNFGFLSAQGRPFEAAEVLRQIMRYDAADAAAVSARVRETAGLESTVDRLLEVYREVIAEHRAGPPPAQEAESKAAAAYLRQLSSRLKTLYELRESREGLRAEVDWMRKSLTWRWRQRLTRASGLVSLYRSARRRLF
jgi:glycosyltransferase involved in cell wall biosynthesis